MLTTTFRQTREFIGQWRRRARSQRELATHDEDWCEISSVRNVQKNFEIVSPNHLKGAALNKHSTRDRSDGGFDMADREAGHYWVCWSAVADQETARRLPAPMMGLWDGRVWWLPRLDRYFFDSELVVVGERLMPPRSIAQAPIAMAG